MSKEEFMVDVNQIVENSITYNGPSSPYTKTAELMREAGLQAIEEVITLSSHTHARTHTLSQKHTYRIQT